MGGALIELQRRPARAAHQQFGRGLGGSLLVLVVMASAACQGGSSDLGASYSFVRFLGETGEGSGQFREPIGIVLGVDGELYVADARNRRIQVFSPEGDFHSQWGPEGDGPGEFGMPVDVAVAPDGSVYVSDYELDRVQKFTAEGTFLLGWGEGGEEIGQFYAPAGLFVGDALVACSRRHRFSALWHSLKTIESRVSRLRQPRVLAVLSRTVAKVDSMGLVVLRCGQCSAGKS